MNSKKTHQKTPLYKTLPPSETLSLLSINCITDSLLVDFS